MMSTTRALCCGVMLCLVVIILSCRKDKDSKPATTTLRYSTPEAKTTENLFSHACANSFYSEISPSYTLNIVEVWVDKCTVGAELTMYIETGSPSGTEVAKAKQQWTSNSSGSGWLEFKPVDLNGKQVQIGYGNPAHFIRLTVDANGCEWGLSEPAVHRINDGYAYIDGDEQADPYKQFTLNIHSVEEL